MSCSLLRLAVNGFYNCLWITDVVIIIIVIMIINIINSITGSINKYNWPIRKQAQSSAQLGPMRTTGGKFKKKSKLIDKSIWDGRGDTFTCYVRRRVKNFKSWKDELVFFITLWQDVPERTTKTSHDNIYTTRRQYNRLSRDSCVVSRKWKWYDYVYRRFYWSANESAEVPGQKLQRWEQMTVQNIVSICFLVEALLIRPLRKLTDFTRCVCDPWAGVLPQITQNSR